MGQSKSKKYKKEYTLRDVVQHLYPNRIAKRTTKNAYNAANGSAEWLACYPRAVTYVMNHLEDKELTEAEEMLDEWNSVGPPDEHKLAYGNPIFPVCTLLIRICRLAEK